jgi:ribosomal protein S18 acetylase RimI-like enzyme
MNLRLVTNNSKYYEFIRELRNHTDNLSGFIIQTNITKEDQIKYMEKYEKFYYIAINESEIPVGFIGVVDNDIRVAVHPDFKNQGVGKFMVNEIINNYPNSIAKIKIDNTASIKLFESCGFKTKFLIMSK